MAPRAARTDVPAGRDLFVAGAITLADLAAAFGRVFDVPPTAVLLPGASDAQWLAAIAQPSRIVVHLLEADGDFPFKVDVDLDAPIDTGRLVALARDRRLTIAWAVDETSLANDYQVAFADGRLAVHPLRFAETEESYACLLLPADDAPA